MAFAGMVFLQLFLPCVPGLFSYLESVRDFDGHAFFLKNVGSLFLTGSLWTRSGLANTPYMEYLPHAAAQPLLFGIAVALAAGFCAAGIVRLWLVQPTARWLVAVLIFPGLLTYAYAVLRHKMLMEWYLGFMLQGRGAHDCGWRLMGNLRLCGDCRSRDGPGPCWQWGWSAPLQCSPTLQDNSC